MECVKELPPRQKEAQQLQERLAKENNCRPTGTECQPTTNETAIDFASQTVSDVASRLELQHPQASFGDILNMILERFPDKNLSAVSVQA